MTAAVRLECTGCGHELGPQVTLPFACPRARPDDDVDHVVTRRIDPSALEFPPALEGNPFVALRGVMSYGARAAAWGVDDERLIALIEQLDAAIARIDGHGFTVTPWRPQRPLAAVVPGFAGSLWSKDETHNVGGSHKARHLMGVMIHLRLAELAGRTSETARPRLAIASCGNAALAAAVVAAAARWPLDVFVPTDADPVVLERLGTLGAEIHPCPRDATPGDPCMRAFRAALRGGSLPFSVQGSDNGLAVEGGLTLGYELAAQIQQGPGQLDALFVQVGGGALGSACARALEDAVAWGVLPSMPRIHTVQTRGAWPLRRAYERVVSDLSERQGLASDGPSATPRARADRLRALPGPVLDEAMAWAARHRGVHMWPWESEPKSVAHGILDDETYDWWALVDVMLRSGGVPVVASEASLIAARDAVARHTDVRASATGTSGVAGLWEGSAELGLGPDATVGVLLTGCQR